MQEILVNSGIHLDCMRLNFATKLSSSNNCTAFIILELDCKLQKNKSTYKLASNALCNRNEFSSYKPNKKEHELICV